MNIQIQFMGGEGHPTEGTYKGTLTRNRTGTIVGNPSQARIGRYLIREDKDWKMTKGYHEMNFTHWSHVEKNEKPDLSCLTFLANLRERHLR